MFATLPPSFAIWHSLLLHCIHWLLHCLIIYNTVFITCHIYIYSLRHLCSLFAIIASMEHSHSLFATLPSSFKIWHSLWLCLHHLQYDILYLLHCIHWLLHCVYYLQYRILSLWYSYLQFVMFDSLFVISHSLVVTEHPLIATLCSLFTRLYSQLAIFTFVVCDVYIHYLRLCIHCLRYSHLQFAKLAFIVCKIAFMTCDIHIYSLRCL